jgi:hypothetical protein
MAPTWSRMPHQPHRVIAVPEANRCWRPACPASHSGDGGGAVVVVASQRKPTSRSLIAISDVESVFNDAVINELANILELEFREPDDFRRFAQSIRQDARLFIEAKDRLNNPKLRQTIAKLYRLTTRAERDDDRAVERLARAVDGTPPDVWDWLARFNPKGSKIPTAAEIRSPATRPRAVQRLRLALSYGGMIKDGRKRPTGKRSRSFEPLLRVPTIEPNRPRSEAEREFVRNLAFTYLSATGKRPPYKVDFQVRGPFSAFVHRCFELAGAPSGYVTRLINEFGRARREAAAYFDQKERLRRDRGEGAKRRCK